jgi:GTP-binding protein EngB required for normal cell division
MIRLTLNDNHRNALLSGFKYIDRLLAEGLAAANPGSDDGAVFSPLVPDATPVQRRVIGDQVAHLRRAIRTALDTCAIPAPPPTVSAIWSLRTHLMAVEIALEDLGPRRLRGYGTLDDATAAGIAALLAQIRTTLAELDGYLAVGLGGDLSARLARLDQTAEEGRLLRELERIVTAHGLVEFRPSLALLVARLEKNWWTVAFVGRVSCGKSSLLNFLLATDVLPTGVTPVTAVPIRIVHGADPQAAVVFASGTPEHIPAGRLGDFASEEKNPGNTRHVTDIVLALPSSRLAGEVCLVDTPGLGSLATDGAAQTLAFLPRCDVGVLMIDAGTTPTEEDLAVARSLLEGGAEVLIVVSKADVLAPSDREKMRAYVAREFTAALGREIPVAPVSVAADHTALAETWWSETLAPRQVCHRALAAATLRRKIGGLRETVVVALSRRAGRTAGPSAAPDAGAQLGAARAALEGARGRAYELPFRTLPSADDVLAAAADVLAGDEAQVDINAGLAQELGHSAAGFAGDFETLLNEVCATAEQALDAAGLGAPSLGVQLLHPASRPLFDPTPVLAAGAISAGWRLWPIQGARRAALRRALRARYAAPLEKALHQYGHVLVRWSERYVDELTAQFNAQAGLVEAMAVPAEPSSHGTANPELVRDLELLRGWPARSVA